MKVSRSSMPQATQITSGKTLHPLWAFLLSFSLVQGGFVRLNRWKILKGSAYSHGSQRQGVLVINFLFFPDSKKTLTLWKQMVHFHKSKNRKPCIYLQVRRSCKRMIQFALPVWDLTPSLSAGREGRGSGIVVFLIKQTSRVFQNPHLDKRFELLAWEGMAMFYQTQIMIFE